MLLSIIVPVYNTKEYLKKCLDSILKAKIDNTEIIIINDGSKDDSEEVIKPYLKYKEIRYIKKENEGLAATKNLGLKEAKGKYISFIDSDDSIDKNFYKDAIPYMKDDYDMIVYDYLTIQSDKKYTTYAKDIRFKNMNDEEGLLYTSIMPSSCNKIVKKELFIKNNLTFPVGLIYEDFATTPILFLSAKKIKYISKPYYNYYIRENSIMRKKEINFDMSYVINILENRLKNFNNYDREKFIFYGYMWRLDDFVFNPIYTLSLKERFKYSKILFKNNRKLFKEINKNKLFINSLNNFREKEREFILKRNKLIASNNIIGFNYLLYKNIRTTKIYNIDNKYYER